MNTTNSDGTTIATSGADQTDVIKEELNHTTSLVFRKRRVGIGTHLPLDEFPAIREQQEEEEEGEEGEEELEDEDQEEEEGVEKGPSAATFILTPEILRNLTKLHEQGLELGLASISTMVYSVVVGCKNMQYETRKSVHWVVPPIPDRGEIKEGVEARFTTEDRSPSKTDLTRINYFHVVRHELKSLKFWRDVAAEAVATFFLISVQCCVPLTWGNPRVYGGRMAGNLAMGCVVTVLIETFGPFGGAHMNPAVSIAMVVAGRMTFIRATMYIPSQCLGAIAGAFFTYYITPPRLRETLAATKVHPDLSAGQGLLAEIWATTLLSLCIFGSTNAIRRPVFMSSVIIGFAVFVGSSVDEFSGSSMNPARSLGPAIVMNEWEHHWIYWLGPILGCLIGSMFYLQVLDRIGRVVEGELEIGEDGEEIVHPSKAPTSDLRPNHTLNGPDETAIDMKKVRKPSIGLQTFSTYS